MQFPSRESIRPDWYAVEVSADDDGQLAYRILQKDLDGNPLPPFTGSSKHPAATDLKEIHSLGSRYIGLFPFMTETGFTEFVKGLREPVADQATEHREEGCHEEDENHEVESGEEDTDDEADEDDEHSPPPAGDAGAAGFHIHDEPDEFGCW